MISKPDSHAEAAKGAEPRRYGRFTPLAERAVFSESVVAWHEVGVALPSDTRRVLVFCGKAGVDRVRMGILYHSVGWCEGPYRLKASDEVTHWAELPEGAELTEPHAKDAKGAEGNQGGLD